MHCDVRLSSLKFDVIWGISEAHGLSTGGIQTRKPDGEVQDQDPRGLGLHLIFSFPIFDGRDVFMRYPQHQLIIVHSVLTFLHELSNHSTYSIQN
jgi:hypothetical protein